MIYTKSPLLILKLGNMERNRDRTTPILTSFGSLSGQQLVLLTFAGLGVRQVGCFVSELRAQSHVSQNNADKYWPAHFTSKGQILVLKQIPHPDFLRATLVTTTKSKD